MSSLEPMPTLPSGTADAMLDALPHPVIMVAADGRVANANAAAESFFEASLPMLRRHSLGDLVPFGSPLLALVDQRKQRAAERHQVAERMAAQHRQRCLEEGFGRGIGVGHPAISRDHDDGVRQSVEHRIGGSRRQRRHGLQAAHAAAFSGSENSSKAAANR